MVTIFVVCWVITLIYAIRLILSLSSSTANYGVIEGKQVIRRVPHPEMMEVKPGDELTANYNLYTYPKTGVGIQMI